MDAQWQPENGDETDYSAGNAVVPLERNLIDPGANTSMEASEESDEVSLDTVFSILKNKRRRCVLNYVCRQEKQITLSELAEHIASIENETTPEMLSSQQRKRVYVALYQCHLEKMDYVDIVDFDKDRGTIEPAEQAPVFQTYLESALHTRNDEGPSEEGSVEAVGDGSGPAIEVDTDAKSHGDDVLSEDFRATVDTPSPASSDARRYLTIASVIGTAVFVLRAVLSLRNEHDSGDRVEESNHDEQWALGPDIKSRSCEVVVFR